MPASTTASPPTPARIWEKKIGDLAVTMLTPGAVADAQQKR
jgi:hypothetical protein